MEATEDLRYPTGKFQIPDVINSESIEDWIETIEKFPARLKMEVENLGKEELEWKHRPEGWTIRQLVHHCADSHMNSFMRFKLALTEDKPVIKPYMEDLWAKLPDASSVPISCSLRILEGLHKRWAYLLRSMSESEFKREFVHPEYNRTYQLGAITALYAWHCNHHLAHIKQARKRKEH